MDSGSRGDGPTILRDTVRYTTSVQGTTYTGNLLHLG